MSSRLNKSVDAAPVAFLTFGCAYVLAVAAIWIAIVVIILHFVGKFW